LWNVVSAGQYGKTYGATPTVVTNAYGSATGTASTTFSYNYTGTNGSFTLPPFNSIYNGHYPSSTLSVVVILSGANGGTGWTGGTVGHGVAGAAGKITATLPASILPLGATVYYSVGGVGLNNGSIASNGGFADGGNAPYDGSMGNYGGGGGGSTWINTVNTITNSPLIACGGGGGGNLVQSGGNGGGPCGGAAGAGGNSNAASNGGTSATSTASGVSTATSTGSGSISIVYTYSYNDPVENVSSTVSGNNFGGTVTVSAATTHLSPTTSTIIFAPWNFPVSGVSCTANTWASSLAPFILAKNTTSVEFGFGSTIAGNKYDYQCNAY
jgi:hypothetical protein